MNVEEDKLCYIQGSINSISNEFSYIADPATNKKIGGCDSDAIGKRKWIFNVTIVDPENPTHSCQVTVFDEICSKFLRIDADAYWESNTDSTTQEKKEDILSKLQAANVTVKGRVKFQQYNDNIVTKVICHDLSICSDLM